MKKILVLAIIIVIIGVLCAFIFNQKEPETVTDPNEKPWTVGDSVEVSSEKSTEKITFDDAVMCFSDYINTTLRESYLFAEETKVYKADEIEKAVVGLYVYDIDSDSQEELSVVYTQDGSFCLDVFEYEDKTAKLSATTKLDLDNLSEEMFLTEKVLCQNIAARMSIFPNGKERAFCLTCELADSAAGYNAYTLVYSYKDGEIALKNSFRLTSKDNKLTLSDTKNSVDLYTAIGTISEDTTDTTDATENITEVEPNTETDVTVESEFDSLIDAFNSAFKDISLKSPDISANGSSLSKYKVTPIENEQKVFEFAGGNGEIMFSENGFLHSFILDV